MDFRQQNHLKMYMRVYDFLNTNIAIFGAVPYIAAFMTLLQSIISQIFSYGSTQGLDRTGIAKYKNQLRDSLMLQGIDIARRVNAYATVTNNPTLSKEVDFTQTDLKHAQEVILIEDCQQIHDAANANVAALATYGVTPAMVTSLQSIITNFTNMLDKPEVGIEDREKATLKLQLLFDEAEDALKKADVMAEMFRISEPVLYQAYRNARQIIDSGIRHIALKALAIEKGNGKAVDNATFTFTHEDSEVTKPIIKETAEKGGFMIKNMPEGTYNLNVTKEGYKPQTLTVAVAHGDMTELTVEMEKTAAS